MGSKEAQKVGGGNMARGRRRSSSRRRKSGKRRVHPKKPKHFKSKRSYRKFLAYIHMRTPSGKIAKRKCDTISARTPKRHKEKVVIIAGKRHHPKIS